MPLESTSRGSIPIGIRKTSHTSADQLLASGTDRPVTAAFDRSVTWTAPPVRCHAIHESTVPKASDAILNTGYKLFPDSKAAKGKESKEEDKEPSTEAVAFAHLMRGVHW